MRMICQGPTCGQVFEGKRRTAKYCSTRCSVAASRAGAATVATPAPPEGEPGPGGGRSNRGMPGPPAPALKLVPEVYETTLATLEAAGRVRTWSGQTALVLAALIDAGGQTGSAMAAMITSHAAAVERALAQGDEDDPVARIQSEAAELGKLRAVPSE